MAEEFQAGICSGNWWNSSRSVLSTGVSPCSLAINNDIGCYSPWQTDMADHLKVARSCAEESNLVSDNSSMVFQDVHASKPCGTTSSLRGSNLNYSNLQMMGYGLSPSSTSSNWNPSLLGGRSTESNIHPMVEENMDTKLEYRRQDSINDTQIQKEDWDMETFSSCANQVSPIDSFKPIAHQEFGLDQQSVSTVTSGTPSIAAQDSTTSGFPLASTNSYGSYIQSLFDADPQPQHSLFNNQSSNYSSTATYSTKDSSANWSKFSSFLKPSAPKQQNGGSVFANNTLFWNASAAALNDIRSNIFNSPRSPYVLPNEDKPNSPISITKSKTEEVRQDSTESVLKKNTACEPAIKRPRIETPSPLPTFKVRKEKLGDRITCLQQLVSPFGKTDTASVLHEAIEYIKFLHAQVNNLSAPYMKSGISSQHPQGTDTLKEMDDSKDLRSRGLCLVPISSTFAVANETTADFWTPSFGSTFR